MGVSVNAFIAAAEQIANEGPAYQHGGDGSGGYCDCIGLIIGAIRRCGGQWRGTHGSNYAARYEVDRIRKITSNVELKRGDVVFKAYEPGQGGYSLPGKYEKGGESYTGDLRDYYHIGIVESANPLNIRHMTTPKAKMDYQLGKWAYAGRLKKLDAEETESTGTAGGGGKKTMETVIISGGNTEKPINMRSIASTASTKIGEIPQGTEVEILEGGGAFSRVKYGNLIGWVMNDYVHRETETGEHISVNRAELEKAYDILGDMLGLRG